MHALPDFIPGRILCERFFTAAVAPILERNFPSLRYAAGRLETGSEVLGFDTPQSRDHDWGPQVTLFVAEDEYSDELRAQIRGIMADELPFEIDGYPTHFESPELDGGRVTLTRRRPISHKVRVTTARAFFQAYLGIDPLVSRELTPAEWLAIPEQHLRTVTRGPVFRDDLGDLQRGRARLQWYPRDVWLYVLAAQWRRLEQEEAPVARRPQVRDLWEADVGEIRAREHHHSDEADGDLREADERATAEGRGSGPDAKRERHDPSDPDAGGD